jgi:hypothetical protein
MEARIRQPVYVSQDLRDVLTCALAAAIDVIQQRAMPVKTPPARPVGWMLCAIGMGS